MQGTLRMNAAGLLLLLLVLQVPAWRPEAFLSSLDPSTLSPVLTARLAGSAATSAAALYASFIESRNFAFWFKQRRAPVLHLVEEEVGCLVGWRVCVGCVVHFRSMSPSDTQVGWADLQR
jgi:hypothetical protein